MELEGSKGQSQLEMGPDPRLFNSLHGSGDRPCEYRVLVVAQIAKRYEVVRDCSRGLESKWLVFCVVFCQAGRYLVCLQDGKQIKADQRGNLSV